MGDGKPKESRPVGAPRLDREGHDLDAPVPQAEPQGGEVPHAEKISHEISVLFSVAEACRRTGEAHAMLFRLSGAKTPDEIKDAIDKARSLLWSAIDLIDFEGDEDDN